MPRPRKPLIFFIDRSLGAYVIAETVRSLGHRAEVHDQYFAPDEVDEVWLRRAGTERWVVLSKDTRIRRRFAELKALLDHDVAAFVFRGGDSSASDMVQALQRAMPAIVRIVRARRRPFVATISTVGAVVVIANKSKLRRTFATKLARLA